MVDKISPSPGIGGTAPVERRMMQDVERVESERSDESRELEGDRAEFSKRPSSADEAERTDSSSDDISASERELAGSGWYRYGMPNAYQSLEP